jgi:predicted anti-sigma-YlaC factor YlaD
MKTCEHQKKGIVALVTGHADENAGRLTSEHLVTCAGCRKYFEEMQAVTQALAVKDGERVAAPSPYMHRRIVRAIQDEERASFGGIFRGVTGPALAALVAGAILVGMLQHGFGVKSGTGVLVKNDPTRIPANSIADSANDPTLGRYVLTAGRSLDQLDQLLAADARKIQSGHEPTYTAANLTE